MASTSYLKNAQLKDKIPGSWDVEVFHEGEADLFKHHTSCRKHPDHEELIPVDTFNITHLPTEYQDRDIIEYIKLVAQLTVRLTVRYVSPDRPATVPGTDTTYPFYENRGKNVMRVGTGIINYVDGNILLIKTATHVVFDEKEAQHTSCHLFYDNGDQPAVCNTAIEIECNYGAPAGKTITDEIFFILFKLSGKRVRQIESIILKFFELRKIIKKRLLRSSYDTHNKPLTIIVSHPHGCSKTISIGRCVEVDDNLDDVRFLYTTPTCPGSSGATVICLDKQVWNLNSVHCGTWKDDTSLNFGLCRYASLTPFGLDVCSPWTREYPYLRLRDSWLLPSCPFPPEFKYNLMLDFINTWSQLCVNLAVEYVSKQRPKFWPGSELPYTWYKERGSREKRHGCGWVDRVDIYPNQYSPDRTCDCDKCRNSLTPERKFAHIYILTSTSLVYDQTEGRTTSSVFFSKSLTMLTGTQPVCSNAETDRSQLVFLTHDLVFAETLKMLLEHVSFLKDKIQDKLSSQLSANPISLKMGPSEFFTIGRCVRAGKHLVYTNEAYEGDVGAPVGALLGNKHFRSDVRGHSGVDPQKIDPQKTVSDTADAIINRRGYLSTDPLGNQKRKRKGIFQNKNVTIGGSLLKYNAKLLILFGLSVFVVLSSAALPLVCRRGYFLHTPRIGPDFCLPCQDGHTYIPVDLHSYRQCWNCTKIIDPEREVLVMQCSKYKNSEILCKSGFYRRLARNSRETDTCEKCSGCQVTTRPCQGYHDSVCCGHPNYDAVLNKDGVYVCKEKPIRCGRGEYLRTSTEQCVVCPANTYRPETDHNKTICLPCLDTDQDSISNREVTQACNTTQPALFECKSGFFRNVSGKDWQLSEEDCRPCQTCPFVGQNCTRHQDTVCCPSSDMVVVDTPLGSICHRTEGQISTSPIDAIIIRSIDDGEECGEAEHLSSHMDNTKENRSRMFCIKCLAGTYNPAVNHTWTSCVNLSDWTGQRISDCPPCPQNTQDDNLHHVIGDYMTEFDIWQVIGNSALLVFLLLNCYHKQICLKLLLDARNILMYLVSFICLTCSNLMLYISVLCLASRVDKTIIFMLNILSSMFLFVSDSIAFYNTYKLKDLYLSSKKRYNKSVTLKDTSKALIDHGTNKPIENDVGTPVIVLGNKHLHVDVCGHTGKYPHDPEYGYSRYLDYQYKSTQLKDLLPVQVNMVDNFITSESEHDE